jgi:hypothetical protein
LLRDCDSELRAGQPRDNSAGAHRSELVGTNVADREKLPMPPDYPNLLVTDRHDPGRAFGERLSLPDVRDHVTDP